MVGPAFERCQVLDREERMDILERQVEGVAHGGEAHEWMLEWWGGRAPEKEGGREGEECERRRAKRDN